MLLTYRSSLIANSHATATFRWPCFPTELRVNKPRLWSYNYDVSPTKCGRRHFASCSYSRATLEAISAPAEEFILHFIMQWWRGPLYLISRDDLLYYWLFREYSYLLEIAYSFDLLSRYRDDIATPAELFAFDGHLVEACSLYFIRITPRIQCCRW
jgi:hypothetical protein